MVNASRGEWHEDGLVQIGANQQYVAEHELQRVIKDMRRKFCTKNSAGCRLRHGSRSEGIGEVRHEQADTRSCRFLRCEAETGLFLDVAPECTISQVKLRMSAVKI